MSIAARDPTFAVRFEGLPFRSCEALPPWFYQGRLAKMPVVETALQKAFEEIRLTVVDF
jgi:hypothetical protein